MISDLQDHLKVILGDGVHDVSGLRVGRGDRLVVVSNLLVASFEGGEITPEGGFVWISFA